MQKITKSFEETQQFGEEFAQQIMAGDTLLLFGNLGAGKTTFMQGFAKGLRIAKRIISPTFIIVRKYEVPNSSSRERSESRSKILKQVQDDNLQQTQGRNDIRSLYHVDLYRTQTEHDLESVGLAEILSEKDAVVAIEWPGKLGSLLPKNRWELHFETLDEDTRRITIEKVS